MYITIVTQTVWIAGAPQSYPGSPEAEMFLVGDGLMVVVAVLVVCNIHTRVMSLPGSV